MFGVLKGSAAFNRGGATFYVYNRTLDEDAAATAVEVEGTLDIDDGEVDLPAPTALENDGGPGSSLETITWASKSITITPAIGSRATFEATVTTGTVDDLKTISKASDDADTEGVSLALAANETSAATGAVAETEAALANTVNMRVVAENGYDDTEFSFIVSRANPVDAKLTALTLGTTRNGTDATLSPALNATATTDEYSAAVPPGTGIGTTTMSVYIRATGKAGQGDMVVKHNGNEVDALDRQSGQAQGAGVHDYQLTVARTGSLQGQRVTIAVESEDGVTYTIEVHLTRN